LTGSATEVCVTYAEAPGLPDSADDRTTPCSHNCKEKPETKNKWYNANAFDKQSKDISFDFKKTLVSTVTHFPYYPLGIQIRTVGPLRSFFGQKRKKNV
jgi:hypothetical protein